MKKTPKAKAKKTVLIGEIRIPLHAVDSIETKRDTAPAFGNIEDAERFGHPQKIVGSKLTIVVDMLRLEQPVKFTEYSRRKR